MIHPYQGPYSYNQATLGAWNSNAIGVYYVGYVLQNGNLFAHYVGRAVGQGGIKNRLLQHLNEDKWLDVTHFGYSGCDTEQEAINFESSEILRLKPKYNAQGS